MNIRFVKNFTLILLIIFTITGCQQDVSQSSIFFRDDIRSHFDDFYVISDYTNILLYILAGLTLLYFWNYLKWAHNEHDLFVDFGGKVTKNRMKRLWMFNKEPYIKVTACTFLLLGAFVSGVATMLVTGGIYYVSFLIIKYFVLWVVGIGIIIALIGLLAAKGENGAGGCLFIIIGAILLIFRNEIRNTGQAWVDWGFSFWDDVNIVDWGGGLFCFWDIILVVLFAPALIFVSFAAFVMLLVLIMLILEYLMMRIYNIRRPCPICGNTRAFEYYADRNHKHPVPLHPGVYGVFTHTNPDTGNKLPTTLFNGKGKLLRKCTNCPHFMIADTGKTFGEEKHFIIIGHKSSGKTYLLYTALAELKNNYFGKRAIQRESTPITNIDDNARRIAAGDDMPTDESDAYTAVQLMVERQSKNPIPYHLFFYDVAGEKFNPKSKSYETAMNFFRNIQTVIFVVDPAMIQYTYNNPSTAIQQWLNQQPPTEHYSLDGTLSILHNIMKDTGRKAEDIDFYFVCVKADLGYFDACGVKFGADVNAVVKSFMINHLNLGNLIQTVENEFKKPIHFDYASVKQEYRNHLRTLFVDLLNKKGIK